MGNEPYIKQATRTSDEWFSNIEAIISSEHLTLCRQNFLARIIVNFPNTVLIYDLDQHLHLGLARLRKR